MDSESVSGFFVAILMPTYNHGLFIAQAIEGVIYQETNYSYKLFIIDDYSTDNTYSLCKHYSDLYPEKIIFSKNDGNLGANKTGELLRNIGFNSSAKYISICEGDDYWTDPNKLQKQVDFLEANPFYAGSAHWTEERTETECLRVMGNLLGNIIDAPKTLSAFSPFHTSSFVFRRNAYQKPPWMKKVFSMDMALFSIVAKSGPIYCISEVMSHYRVHEHGITRNRPVNYNYLFHKRRLRLIRYLDAFHNYRYHSQALQLIAYHRKNMHEGRPHTPGYWVEKMRDFFNRYLNRIRNFSMRLKSHLKKHAASR